MKEVMSIDETAKFLKLPKTTIYKYARNRKIPACKVGRRWRFERNTLEKWLEGKMNSPELENNETTSK